MSTREEPGPLDGMESAKPGEPVFTLQGGDPTAAPLVMLWADIARRRSIGGQVDPTMWERLKRAVTLEPREDKRAGLLHRAREAEGIAWAMDEYRRGEVATEAEAEKSTPSKPTYSGHVEDPAEVDAKAEWEAHRDAACVFDDALSRVLDASGKLERYGFTRDNVTDEAGAYRRGVERAVELLKEASMFVRPKRASYAHRASGNADPS